MSKPFPSKRRIFLITIVVIGVITPITIIVSIVIFPSSYDTTQKIVILSVTALTSTIAILSGLSSVFDFFKNVIENSKSSSISIGKTNNVPRPQIFFGRAKEIEGIIKLLTNKKIKSVVITGIGGIGKSTITQEIAYRIYKRFSGGMAWISARDTLEFSLEQATKEILQILNITREPSQVSQTELIKYLQVKPTLIILDNMESVSLEELNKLKSFLGKLSASWGSKVIITVRSGFDLFDEKTDESVFNIDSGLDETSSVQYLTVLAKDKKTTAELLNEAKWITGRVQGHPKMLEIIVGAARRRGWQRARELIENLSGELADRMDELYGGAINLLESEGKEVITRLTLFPSSWFVYEDVMAACGDVEDKITAKGLDQVVDSGLVSFHVENNIYDTHQTVIDYVVQRFPLTNAEYRIACLRLARHFGNQGRLGRAVWMWKEAHDKWKELKLNQAINVLGETVRHWIESSPKQVYKRRS